MIHAIHARQHGSVLIVSMLMLLVLTLIGITAMGTSTLEEKMAGNSRDQNIAFQASEAALRDAETFLNGIVSTAGFTNTNGLYALNANPDIFSNTAWSATNSRGYTSTLPGVSTQPRYIIELVATIGGPTVDITDPLDSGGTVTMFRITARGTGGTDNASVFLQSYFGKQL